MSIFKKFVAPLFAVALVAVMGVSLLSNTGTAHAAANTVSAQTPTVGLGAAVTGGLTAATNPIPAWSAGTLLAPIKFTLTAGETWVGTIILTAPAADTFNAIGAANGLGAASSSCTVTVVATGVEDAVAHCTAAVAANVLTITSNAGAAGATSLVTITPPTLKVPNNTVAGTVVLSGTTPGTTAGFTLPAGVVATLGVGKDFLLAWNTSTTAPANPPANGYSAATATADPNGAGGAICAFAATTTAGTATVGLPVTFTVSLGVVSTGTAKTALAVTGTTGSVCTNYRGGGGIAGTDTGIVSNSLSNVVDTLSIVLTAPNGSTASKLIIQVPTNLAVSPTRVNVSPGYISPMTQTNFAVQVQDSAGLGVGGQVLLITADKGYVVSGFGAAACGTSKAVTATSALSTAPLALTAGGTAVTGAVQLSYCGNQLDASGQATITVSNVSTSMANVTTTIATSERPNKVTASFNNGVISATVTDSNGNKVADNTAIQFTISANAGAVSNACTTTTNGSAQSAVSLNSGAGTVIVTAIYNESGAGAAGCAAAAAVATAGTLQLPAYTLGGAQSVSTVVNIGTVVTPPNTGPVGVTTGAGTFAGSVVFSAAPNKQASAVFNGGTIAQLETAVTAAKGTGVWAQDSKGNFVLDIVGGPTFVNAPFTTAFPTGFSGVTAVTIVAQ